MEKHPLLADLGGERIVIAGVSGFLGLSMADAFTDAGAEVTRVFSFGLLSWNQ